jgi:hypothetical protein
MNISAKIIAVTMLYTPPNISGATRSKVLLHDAPNKNSTINPIKGIYLFLASLLKFLNINIAQRTIKPPIMISSLTYILVWPNKYECIPTSFGKIQKYVDNTIAMIVLDKLYDSGEYKPLTESEKATANLLVFSDRLPQ